MDNEYKYTGDLFLLFTSPLHDPLSYKRAAQLGLLESVSIVRVEVGFC